MKVALLVPGGVDPSCEFEVIPALLWLVERLAREHDVHLFPTDQPGRPTSYELLGARVHRARTGRSTARCVGRVLQEHRRGSFDLFHAFWVLRPGVIAALLARALGRPAVLHVAGGELVHLPEIDYGGLGTWRRRVATRFAMRTAARVTVASRSMAELVTEHRARAQLVPLGVDRDRWPPQEPVRRGAGEPARLVHVASLNPVKDQATLLRAVKHLRDRGVEAVLDVAGQDTLAGALQRLARELGIDGAVTFHGFLPQSRLRPLVEKAHVMVISSRHEAGPVALLEAAVAGVPTVGTAVGHLKDWAPDAARAVPVADPPALAGAILELLLDEELRLDVARKAQQLALRNDADHTAERVMALYADLVAARG